MYAKCRTLYSSSSFNVPKQLLTGFLDDAENHHRCHLQNTLNFADSASVKTDDTLVFYKGEFYEIVQIVKPNVTMVKLRTAALKTPEINLPWNAVEVRMYVGRCNLEHTICVHRDDIKAKAIRCEDIISSMYPYWIVT